MSPRRGAASWPERRILSFLMAAPRRPPSHPSLTAGSVRRYSRMAAASGRACGTINNQNRTAAHSLTMGGRRPQACALAHFDTVTQERRRRIPKLAASTCAGHFHPRRRSWLGPRPAVAACARAVQRYRRIGGGAGTRKGHVQWFTCANDEVRCVTRRGRYFCSDKGESATATLENHYVVKTRPAAATDRGVGSSSTDGRTPCCRHDRFDPPGHLIDDAEYRGRLPSCTVRIASTSPRLFGQVMERKRE